MRGKSLLIVYRTLVFSSAWKKASLICVNWINNRRKQLKDSPCGKVVELLCNVPIVAGHEIDQPNSYQFFSWRTGPTYNRHRREHVQGRPGINHSNRQESKFLKFSSTLAPSAFSKKVARAHASDKKGCLSHTCMLVAIGMAIQKGNSQIIQAAVQDWCRRVSRGRLPVALGECTLNKVKVLIKAKILIKVKVLLKVVIQYNLFRSLHSDYCSFLQKTLFLFLARLRNVYAKLGYDTATSGTCECTSST